MTDPSPHQAFHEPSPAERAFTGALNEMGTGQLARLRRSAGSSIHEAKMEWSFYRWLPRGDHVNPETYFLVATLFAVAGPSEVPGQNVGAALRKLANQADVSAESLDRRMAILLNAQFGSGPGIDREPGELAFRLRQVVKLLAARHDRRLIPDWAQLLHDVNQWRMPGKPVHKRWARDFFAPAAPASDPTSRQDTDIESEEN